MSDEPAIIVVTGVQAAGKSTVAGLLARRFARGVHIEADTLQRMIVSGAMWPEQPGIPMGEAAAQLRLRLRNLCLLGRSFSDAGFNVVLDDIIIGDRWEQLLSEMGNMPVSLVVLAPNIKVVLARDRARAKRTLGEAWARYLDGELRKTMDGVGLWIDSTEQTPDATVEAILHGLHRDGFTPRSGE